MYHTWDFFCLFLGLFDYHPVHLSLISAIRISRAELTTSS